MSSDQLQLLIDVGHDLASIKYYALAVATLFFYDYFLTLADEIKYAWRGRKSWVFAIFLANRYLPFGYQLWVLILSYRPTMVESVCNKTAFYSALSFVGTTLLAQVVITLRVYAVTSKNRIVTSCLCVITTSQFIFGMYWTVRVAMEGAQQVPPIPLDPFRVCVFMRHRSWEIGFTVTSLVYDSLAFLIVVYLVVRSNIDKIPMSGLLRTIARDATYYFLVIFTSHLIFVSALLFARPAIQLLPGSGSSVYLPVMITRLLLSIKKAGAPSEEHPWNFGGAPTQSSMRTSGNRSTVNPKDEIRLDTFTSTSEGAKSEMMV